MLGRNQLHQIKTTMEAPVALYLFWVLFSRTKFTSAIFQVSSLSLLGVRLFLAIEGTSAKLLMRYENCWLLKKRSYSCELHRLLIQCPTHRQHSIQRYAIWERHLICSYWFDNYFMWFLHTHYRLLSLWKDKVVNLN